MKLKPQAVIFLKKTLGEEGFETLFKSDLYKKKTATALDIKEISTALQVVPRTILSFLNRELKELPEGGHKEVKIPVEPEAFLSVTKYANDVYSGEIRQKGEIVATYKYRSLPGVGLVIMSTFELYDVTDLSHMGSDHNKEDLTSKVQDIIDDRMKMTGIISSIVDRKLSEREAMDQLIRSRLTQMFRESSESVSKEEIKKVPDSSSKPKKPLKLREFLDKKNKIEKKESSHLVTLEKNDSVNCPDCGNKIFDQSGFSGCVCYGQDMDKKIFIKKSEEGFKLSFSKDWDKENIEMLLHVIRERKNRSSK